MPAKVTFELPKRIFLLLLALVLLAQLMIGPLASISPARAASQSTDISPNNDDASWNDFLSSWDNLATILENPDKLKFSPQDIEALKKYQVDIRVTDYLSYLVTPDYQGGAGFSYLKIRRITKNFQSNGSGKLDKETLDALEEDNGVVSAHHDGKAVDIAEIGQITCKMVEHRRIGGSTTHWQAPRPIEVAWQTKDGIANSPTPKGQSLAEISGNLTANGMLTLLNDSGEMDEYADFVKGLSLGDVLTYVGMNVYLKNIGTGKVVADPLADGLAHVVGGLVLEKNFPDLPPGMTLGNNDDDARVAFAKARLEEGLDLPAGSLRGYGWDNILDAAGKRSLENSLGLPALYFESHQLDEANRLETVKGAVDFLADGDSTFNFMAGTMAKVKQNDSDAFRMAGVNALASSLKMTAEQRQTLEQAVTNKKEIAFNRDFFDSLPVEKTITIDDLNNIFSSQSTDNSAVKDSLKAQGLELIKGAISKNSPTKFQGLSQQLLDKLTSGSELKLGELKQEIGITKLANQSDLTSSETKSAQQGNDSRLASKVADYFNQEFQLSGESRVSQTDISAALKAKDWSAFQKLGGNQADRAMKWQKGTGLAVIKGQKTLEQAGQEVFAASLSGVLGLSDDYQLKLEGNLPQNYGQALTEQRLGLSANSLGGKENAAVLSREQLLALGVAEANQSDWVSIVQLWPDADYWSDAERNLNWYNIDATLGVSPGTTKSYLRGEISTNDLAQKVGGQAMAGISIDKFWDYFDLSDKFHLSDNDNKVLINTLKDWNNASLDQRSQSIKLAVSLVSRGFDQKAGLSVGAFASFIFSPNGSESTKQVLRQGVWLMLQSIGVNSPNFSEQSYYDLFDLLIKAFDKKFAKDEKNNDYQNLTTMLLSLSGIPSRYKADAQNFISGNYKASINSWSSVLWTNFANQYLPNDAQLSYEQMHNAFATDDPQLIEDRAFAIASNVYPPGEFSQDQYDRLPDEVRNNNRLQARRQLTQEARDTAQYKISDAYLNKALQPNGVFLPTNFSQVMFTGSAQERAELLRNAGFTAIDAVLKKLEPSYPVGSLKRLFDGQLSAEEGKKIILSILKRPGADFGGFESDFLINFYSFAEAGNKNGFYTNDKYAGMWSSFDGWLEKTLGIGDLPTNVSKSIYYSSEHNWDLNSSFSEDGQVVIPSLSQLGENFLTEKVTHWADKIMDLPTGSAFQLYQLSRGVQSASQSLSQAHLASDIKNLTGGAVDLGSTDVGAARAGLAKAQAALWVFAITTALSLCSACQQIFGSVDKAIGAPPGFTNMLVAGSIAAAFGLGWTGVIVAVAYFFLGVSSVSYDCPIPPTDYFASPNFDNAEDQVSYHWDNLYTDPSQEIKDTPKVGQTPWQWQDSGVKFADGNDQSLWMMWARYNVGKLIKATLDYGASNDDFGKPRQLITYRQANAEYFYSNQELITSAFGQREKNNEHIGIGFSQKSTKTTDWLHVGFGGLF